MRVRRQSLTNRTLLLCISLGLLVGVVGCGDDETPLLIRPFTSVDLPTGTTYTLVVELTSVPESETIVEVENTFAGQVKVTPSLLTYKAGDDPPQQDVDVLGVSSTNNQYAKIVFKIQGSSASQTLEVRVTDPS